LTCRYDLVKIKAKFLFAHVEFQNNNLGWQSMIYIT
jgi:hypothetical protein